MKISHVIRGEEWLPSAPHHVLLYRFLGWESQMPRFAHLPLLLKPDGNGKLSKRDADRMGFPIFPLTWTDPRTQETSKGFRESGYLPEALLNFLALLGWNPGTPQELFTLGELVEAFSLERVGKAGAKFDIQKAQWFNQHYLRALPIENLAEFLLESLREHQISCTPDLALKITALLRERITFPQDLWEQGKLFFVAPSEYDPSAVSKKWTPEAATVLQEYQEKIASLPALPGDLAKSLFEETCVAHQLKSGQVLAALRISITGGMSGPDLMQTIEVLGGDETSRRIREAVKKLAVPTS